MIKHIQARRESETLGAKGFTLIELLVVIVILGILAAVVVFAVSGITNRGDASACRTEARTVRTAVEAYQANPTNTARLYPANIGALSPQYLSKAPTLVTYTATGTPAGTNYTLAWSTAGGCTTHVNSGETP